MIDKNAINKARIAYYNLLGKIFIFKNADRRFAGAADMLPPLIDNAIDERSKNALKILLEALSLDNGESLAKEFDDIFYSLGSKTIKTTASYYSEGSELGSKQLEVKNLLAQTPIRRDEHNYKEPEDSVGFLFVFMQKLIELAELDKKRYEKLQHSVFTQIINPFINTFSNEVFIHGKSSLYKNAAIILNSFMEFERLYFNAPYCPPMEINVKGSVSEQIEEARRAKNRAKKLLDSGCRI